MRRRAAEGFGRGASCDRIAITVTLLQTRPAGGDSSIGRHQIHELGATWMRLRARRRSPTLAAKIHEPSDRLLTSSLRQSLEATDARRCRQIGEQPAGAAAGDDGQVEEACDQHLGPRRLLGCPHLPDVVDRTFQSPRRHRHRHPRGVAQIEAAVRADMLWDQIRLSEGSQGAAAGGAAITQAATMPETGDPRRQPPRPPKIRCPILGKTRGAILDPGRPVSAGGRAQRQQERRRRAVRRRQRRDRPTRHTRASTEPRRERVGEMPVETGRPHPVAQPEHVGESPWRDAVGDRQTMKPARRQFVGLGVGDDRPPIRDDIPVSFADLDGEAGRAAHRRPSRWGAVRRRDTGT